MRPLLAALIVGSVVVSFTGRTAAATQSITGQLVDAVCYKLHKANIGANHELAGGHEKNCAVKCVRTGMPVAVLTSDGQLYVVTGALAADDNAGLAPFLNHRMTLTGDVTRGAGMMTIAATGLRMVDK